MTVAALRAALRIARRDATRAKGRSALVVAMIGLPATAITALAVLLSTADVTPVERLPWDLGTADAKVTGYGRVAVHQDPKMINVLPTGDPGGGARPWRAAEVAAALGPGTRLVPLTQGGAVFRTEHGYARAAVWEVDVREPLTDGIVLMGRGRAPRSENEVLVSRGIAERGFGIGATLRVTRDGTPMRVVGIALDPHFPGEPLIVAPPDAGILGADAGRSWLADAPAPVSWDEVRRLNRDGLAVLSRAVVHNPPAASEVPEEVRIITGGADGTAILVVALIVAMLLLEVVLLAGPAFAVGLRRQRRQLALIAASGGDGRHIRAVVLAGGLVLGASAAVLGVLAGFGLAAAAAPVLARFTWVGPFEVPWPQVTAVTVVAAGSGLLAALVPAVQAARMDVVAALGGRRGQVRTRRGWPVVGLVLTGVGVASTVLAVRIGEIGIVAGAIITQLGLVVASPWIVGLVGRLAGRFPLPLRLAARDAARNRGRTAPAVAAITGAMAGVTALGIGVASDLAESRAEYVPRAPMGTAMLQMWSVGRSSTGPDDAQRAVRDSLRQVLERELPGVPILPVRKAVIEPCDEFRAQCRTLEVTRRSCGPDDCPSPGGAVMSTEFGYVVGGERTLNALLAHDDPAAARALANGKAVVFDPAVVVDDGVTMEVLRYPQGEGRSVVERRVRLPAVASDTTSSAVMLLPRSAMERLDASLRTAAYVVDPDDHLVTRQQEQRVREAVTAVTNYATLYVERGFDRSLTVPLLLLAAAGGAMVVGGTLIATGLAAADSRPDLATLAAVGASPGTRRLLAMGQAGVVAVLGVGLGLMAGAVPGIAVTWPLTTAGGDVYASGPQVPGPVIDIPWLLLGGVAVVLPLLAVLVAGLFTRSRLPLVHRIER